jgi:DDE superfamily endonuclease
MTCSGRWSCGGVPGVPDGRAGVAGPEQDTDRAGRGRASDRAQHPAVRRLQFFLSESRWDPDQVNARRLEPLLADPATARTIRVLVIDDSGDRKDGTATAYVAGSG